MQWIPRKVNVTPSALHVTHCGYMSRNVSRMIFFLRNLPIYITSDISFLLHVVITLLDTVSYDIAEHILIGLNRL